MPLFLWIPAARRRPGSDPSASSLGSLDRPGQTLAAQKVAELLRQTLRGTVGWGARARQWPPVDETRRRRNKDSATTRTLARSGQVIHGPAALVASIRAPLLRTPRLRAPLLVRLSAVKPGKCQFVSLANEPRKAGAAAQGMGSRRRGHGLASLSAALGLRTTCRPPSRPRGCAGTSPGDYNMGLLAREGTGGERHTLGTL